jgi:hypothetical protein
VDGAQVGVLEQVYEEGLGGLLQRQDGLRLPAQLLARGLVLEGDFADLGGGKGVLIGGKVFGRERGGGSLPGAKRAALA